MQEERFISISSSRNYDGRANQRGGEITMINFDQKLKEKLKQNIEFWDEEVDDINRNEIINRAYKADKDLIGILIKDKEIRETFFDKIEEYWVF